MKMVPVYTGAAKKSYYKFLKEPLWLPTQEEVDQYTKHLGNPSNVLEFKDRRKIMEPDYVPEPSALYWTKDGSMVVSSTVDVPDMTKEATEWWFVWHLLDPLRYMIWDPQDHYNLKITDEVRKKILDTSIPIAERSWYAPNEVLESFNGEKPRKLMINFCNPEEVGFDRSRIGSENCYAIICNKESLKAGPFRIPIVMTEILRKGPKGTNIWNAHWWVGSSYQEGKDITQKVPMKKFLSKVSSRLVVHNQIEMRHLNAILPSLYEEYKDKPFDTE